MGFWEGKRVLVTGGTGFCGSFAVERLVSLGAEVTVASREGRDANGNLSSVAGRVKIIRADLASLADCRAACSGSEIVMNLAADVGGIEYNIKNPGSIFRANMLICSNMIEAARLEDVERFQAVSSICVYRRFPSYPTPEEEGFEGWPEPTNEGYGWAKRMAEFSAMAYAKQYGMKVSIPRPANAYGPRDHFEPGRSHVVAALVKRVCDGKEDPLVVWGDGSQTRSFLYAEDFARGLVMAVEKYPRPDPVNIGSDEETRISDLVRAIIRICGSKAAVA